MAKRHFNADLFRFLSELGDNNHKEWWEANKPRYVEVVREPALELIADLAEPLAGVSPHLLAAARTVGGSLMRPYRDTRFSRDKTPYKTNVGIRFQHGSARDVHSPGFYLHLEPRRCFAGAGLWRPEASLAARIRLAVHDDPLGWEEAVAFATSPPTWKLDRIEAEMLRRVPRELDGEHSRRDDMRLKSFTASARLTQREVTTSGFDDRLAAAFAAARPFLGFVCRAVGLPF